MASLPKIGLYFLTIAFLLIAASFGMVMSVERFSVLARTSTMAIFAVLCLTSFFSARGLAKKQRWSWWSSLIFYCVSVLLFSFFQFNSIANTPAHPAHQGFSQGAGGMPFFFLYFHAFWAVLSAAMLFILVVFRKNYS
jgi:hypothetical protein